MRAASSLFLRTVGVAIAMAGAGCLAVYPELTTATHKPLPGLTLDPAPPEDTRWIKFTSARIPERTRDGRTWDQAFGSLPNPYAKLIVNGEELLRTPVQSSTLEPTWPNGPKGNFKIDLANDRLRVELWNSTPINDVPVGSRDLGHVSEDARLAGEIHADLEGRGEVVIAFEPAHAVIGLGVSYELRSESCFVTKALPQGPADRAGVQKGDEIIKVGGRDVKGMSADEIRSAFNGVPLTGLPLVLRLTAGATTNVVLKEGPIYPFYKDVPELE